ncbi:helix-turn-helix domain-containing protein [Isoptericola jiangsuensis]|nr:helix-turn-helix domain-containing protein [Isoptericola jiangsuensis]
MTLLGVSEAAERLGVSTRRVQHLVASGHLRQVARGVVDEASVERLLAVRGASHVRAWSELTAWGAVAILSGAEADWMGERQRARLRARLRTITAGDLVERARNRAVVARYRAHPSSGRHLRAEIVHAAGLAGRLGLAETNAVDGYLAAKDVSGVVRRHGLMRDDEGRVTLRATTVDLDIVHDLIDRGTVLAALDLAESLDVRERRAGLDAIGDVLEGFRG